MIKIIAILLMLCDHIGRVFFPDDVMFTLIGRLTFPLFAWGIAKGAQRTRNIWKYAAKLLILAIVSQYPYQILFDNGELNVCFTLLTGLLLIKLLGSKISFFIKLVAGTALLAAAHFLHFDYEVYGVLTIVIFYMCNDKTLLISLQSITTVLGTIFYEYPLTQLAAALATPLIIKLEKYDFRVNKMLFYVFYPTHLMLLYLIQLYIQAK